METHKICKHTKHTKHNTATVVPKPSDLLVFVKLAGRERVGEAWEAAILIRPSARAPVVNSVWR